MNLLISKLLDWFVFGGTMFFAAGAVAAPEAAAPAGIVKFDERGRAGNDFAARRRAFDCRHRQRRDQRSRSGTHQAADTTQPAVEAAKPAPASEARSRTGEAAAEAANPAAEAAKPAAEVNPLDKLGPLPAEKITAALAEAPPEVQAFLKDKGLSVETLTANARMAAEGVQYKERFPTLEAADTALDGAKNFFAIEDKFGAIQSGNDPANFNNFMAHLAELSFERDAQGKPIPDPANPEPSRTTARLQN